MDAAGELVGDDQYSRFHREMMSLGVQQVESLARVEALLKVLVESQLNTQLQLSQIVSNTRITTCIGYKNDEEKHKLATNPSSSINPLHQRASALMSSTLLTPEEDNINATDNLATNLKRPPTGSDNQEISDVIPDDHNDAEDVCQITSKDVLDGYEELYHAAIKGNWEVASKLLEKNPEAITKVITTDAETVLHVAIADANLIFIEEILKLIPPEMLEYRTGDDGSTALHYAAVFGRAKAAELIVNKNLKLTQIVNGAGRVPLNSALISVTAGQRETVEYLYSVTRHEHPSPFSGNQGDSLLCGMIDAGFYDIASSLVQRFPELVIDPTKKVRTSAINYMAERPFAFASGAKHTFWQHLIYSLINVDINSAYELDNHTKERNAQRGLEGTNGDKEDLVERFEGPYRDEENPTANSENTEEDKPKPFRWETVGVSVFMLPYLISLMIKFFFVFTVRFIWTPVTRMKELYKQLYNDKVKHIQAKYLVKRIFTSLKERMTKPGVKEFFKGSNVMKMAIRHGSVEFVELCLQLFPSLIWDKMGGEHILQMAIAERNETILTLICKVDEKEKIDLVSKSDDNGNTILHYAAKLAPSARLNSISGAYLQMQREMQWFKGVENMISEHMKFKRNKNGETAHHIFKREHKELKESGEKWLKDTSGSCMLVAALIATVAFASAFTVPGVYTSRYAEIDFLKSLPNKLIIGLATLFISMASVLVAFGASLLIMLGEKVMWVLIPIVVFSCVPVTLFAWLQLPLFFDMIRSTYLGRLFGEHTYISSLQLNSKKED
ncbi:hypothetical protein C5167_024845 [Papaver somniferum]|uniref:PGG domain-containing protein n=1 Tax=Papaver somniferum TaxID=3469 RepID=A0A4Y7JTH2_PAPSO|nr:uncharacterized protein LOC113283745 isoform X2 [Papaver somniferum]RZC63088.1 hypothetical protein C5167_024845 [Papaver somniferum]